MRRAVSMVLVIVSVVVGTRCSSSGGDPGVTTLLVHGAQGTVRMSVEVADSPNERERGLMGRTSLGADRGMVFLFEDVSDGPVTVEFWMKDTLLPLSIAFWDAGGRIVGIRDMDPCGEDPCPTYGSPEPYVGALEVNAGFFTEHGVTIGDRIELAG